jgi:glycosyltransferase involved in cell wall biosynthesis
MPMKGQFDGRGQWDGASRTLATSHRLASTLPMKATKRQRSTGCSPEVLWSGHFYDLSGYGKMNRELLFRVANNMRVGLHRGGIAQEITLVDPLTKARLDAHAGETVGEKAPLLQVYTPVMDVRGRMRICYTMMETQRLHADFVSRLNAMYDEVWFPTAWNLDVAKDCGLKTPGRVMPLGVNSFVFNPKEERPILPKCLLQTTSRAGTHDSPEGFVFIFSGVPTFRKGYDVLLSAFENAFENDADAALVLFTTYSRISTARYDPWKGGPEPKNRKAKVYELTGMFTDHELATVYNGCDCYVCASRGEGWNLPLCLIEGSQVDTERGPVPIEHVEAGDVVLDHNGKRATVEGTTSRPYCGQVISIRRLGDSIPLVSDPLHPHLIIKRGCKKYADAANKIRSGKSKPEWIKAEDVQKGDFVCITKPSPIKKGAPSPLVVSDYVKGLTEDAPGFVSLPGSYKTSLPVTLRTVAEKLGVSFRHVSKILNHGRKNPGGRKYSRQHVSYITETAKACGYKRPEPVCIKNKIRMTPEVGFFFGLYIAEGCPMDLDRGLVMTLHKSETWAADLCERVLKNDFGVECCRRSPGNKIVIKASSTILGRLFGSLFGWGARNKRIPLRWKKYDWVRHVVSGIFYGDGCFHRKQQMYSFSTTSQNLRKDIFDTLLRFGVFAMVSEGRKDEVTIRISPQFDERFFNLFIPRKPYSDCVVRKPIRYDRVLETKKYFIVPIDDVKRVRYSGNLRNLHVSGGNSFTVRGMATHNCEAASCGVPAIAPLAYSHHETLDEKVAFTFRPDGYEPIPDSKKISHWYEDMPFAAFHKKAHDDLVDLMRYVKNNPQKAKERGALLMKRLHTSFSWEIAADRVTRLLLEVQP